MHQKVDQAQLQIRNKIHAYYRQDLGINHLKYSQISNLKAAIDFIEEIQHQQRKPESRNADAGYGNGPDDLI